MTSFLNMPSPDSHKENVKLRNTPDFQKTTQHPTNNKTLPYPTRPKESSTNPITQPVVLITEKKRDETQKTEGIVNIHLTDENDKDRASVSPLALVKPAEQEKSPISVKVAEQEKLVSFRERLRADAEALDDKGPYILSKMPPPFWREYAEFMAFFDSERIDNYSLADCKYLHKEFKEFFTFVLAHQKYVK